MVLAKVVGIVLAVLSAVCSVILLGSFFVDGPVIAELAERARVSAMILVPTALIYVVIMERRKRAMPNDQAVHEPPAT